MTTQDWKKRNDPKEMAKLVSNPEVDMDELVRHALRDSCATLSGDELYAAAMEAKEKFDERSCVENYLRMACLYKLAVDDLAERQRRCGVQKTVEFDRRYPGNIDHDVRGITDNLAGAVMMVEKQEALAAAKQKYQPLFLSQRNRVKALNGWLRVGDDATVSLPCKERERFYRGVPRQEDTRHYCSLNYGFNEMEWQDFLLDLNDAEEAMEGLNIEANFRRLLTDLTAKLLDESPSPDNCVRALVMGEVINKWLSAEANAETSQTSAQDEMMNNMQKISELISTIGANWELLREKTGFDWRALCEALAIERIFVGEKIAESSISGDTQYRKFQKCLRKAWQSMQPTEDAKADFAVVGEMGKMVTFFINGEAGY